MNKEVHNRIEDSSNLLTASSQSEHGIRQNPFIYYNYNNKKVLINFSMGMFGGLR